MTSDIDRDSPSPYPPSTPDFDSDDEGALPSSLASYGLRASIAALTDRRLRDIVLRLADSNIQFRRALQREVAFLEELDTPPTTPTTPMHSHRRPKTKRASRSRKSRSSSRKAVAPKATPGTGNSILTEFPLPPDGNTSGNCVYHPGMLGYQSYRAQMCLIWPSLPPQVDWRTRFTSLSQEPRTAPRSRSCRRSQCGVAAMKMNGVQGAF